MMRRAAMALFLTVLAAPAAADMYRCGGVWGNKPCGNGEAGQVIRERAPRPIAAAAEAAPAPTAQPAVQAALQTPRTSDGVSYEPNVSLRMRSTFRTPLQFEYNMEQTDFRHWRFQGRVNGSGDARATLKYRYRDRWGNIVETKTIKTVLFKLADTGEERPFSFTVDKPTPNAIAEYEFTAEYVGKFNGSLDLRGCCENDAGAICLRGGEVRCAQGAISIRCRCSD